MQRFSRRFAFRTTCNINTLIRKTAEIVSPDVRCRQKQWTPLLLAVVFTTSSIVAFAVGGTARVAEKGVALQGHAKRYMRINEYLFHGTQKGTAIAMQAQQSATREDINSIRHS